MKIAADPQPAQALPSSVRTARQTSPLKRANPPPLVDSGYHGSQPQDAMDIDDEDAEALPESATLPFNQDNTKHDHIAIHSSPKRAAPQSPVHQKSPAPTVDTVGDELEAQYFTAQIVKLTSPPIKMIQPESTTPMGSPSRPAAQEPPKDASPVEMSPEKEATPVVEPTAPRPDDQSEPQSDVLSDAQLDDQPAHQSDAPSDAQLDDQPEPQSDASSDAQLDAQSEPHSEAHSDAQSDVESEDSDAQSDAEPEAQAEAEPEILREVQHEPRSEPEPSAQQEVQPESQPEAEQEPQPEALPEALAQPQSEPEPTSLQEKLPEAEAAADIDAMDTALDEKEGSPSDGSSPIRPVVRKSSLNFASLPAREPMTHKSTGHRVSRLSHLDQNRTSYYNRHTGGKSLGHARPEESDDDNGMDLDDDDEDEIDTVAPQKVAESEEAIAHTKTYTQRLQDQISKLGQTQPPTSRPSKSISTAVPVPQPSFATTTPAPQRSSREKTPMTQATPGAFPEDDDDDWILPLGTPDNASNTPRPGMLKSYSADVVEGIAGKATVSGSDFAAPKPQQPESARKSPQRSEVPLRVASQLGHHKSMSVPSLPQLAQQEQADSDGGDVKKTASALNPPMNMVSENTVDVQTSPAKSPTRGVFRESPLKHVKGKLSSILKSSRGLLASAELQMSPSANRFGAHTGPSTASVDRIEDKGSNPLYPDLSKQLTDVDAPPSPTRNVPGSPTRTVPGSPTRPEGRRTRASIEREKAEERKKKEQAKEARRMAKQEEELEKAREKERERARVFSQEQERIAALEKQVAAQKEQERKAAAAAPTPSHPAKLTRASPHKAKAQLETEVRVDDEDTDMVDVPAAKPPPSAHRTAVPPPPSVAKPTQIKRPIRPTKESATKPRQAPPTVIKVNMAPKQGQQTPFQPNSSVASSIADPFRSSRMEPPSLQKKASQASLKDKSTAIRPPALVRAERMKEKEEKNAQAKREAKAEMARKRAAAQEEERRREQQQKMEAERQKEEERKQAAAQALAKKNAQRQAMLEKAKQTRAPPPAPRAVNGQPDYKGLQGEPSAIRPPSRLQSTAHRSQEELGRPVNSLMSSTIKPSAKRTMQQEPKETKRMRMSDDLDDDIETEKKPSLKGAPVRPSGGFKKVTAATMLPQGQKPSKPQDMTAKSLFPSGYMAAGQGVNRDLFKSTLTSQHPPGKTAHPLDMAQVSKSTIPFAPNPAGPSLKTPARPVGLAGAKSVAKSATRSSPRFQNGEAIVLPEINTDDEDESDDDDQKNMFPSWTDSPALREALFDQETVDPMAVFGAPGPLNMEEVFSKSKDRWAKFRARTSSANWSGADRLTEDDIRKDLAARDKLRRDGAWSYEMSKDVL